jgi:hypothetical protein
MRKTMTRSFSCKESLTEYRTSSRTLTQAERTTVYAMTSVTYDVRVEDA